MADYHEDNASFMMYKEWEDLFESLESDEERSALIMAIFAFASRNETPDFHGALKIAFLMMSKQLDRDGAKWEKKCERNAENVRKRWEKANADKSESIESNTTVYERIPVNTNDTDKDKDKDKDKEISKEKEKTKEKETTKEKGKSNKNIGDDYEPSQNNQLIGILKELANSGDKNKLREVFENHKEELQITNTSNKDITKPIKVNAKMQNLQTEIEEKIRSNNKVIDILKKIDKTIQDRNITIYEPKNPTVDRSKVNGLTLNTPKKDTKEMGMGLDLNKK